MLKVIIIDDEALVRVGLKSMISWEERGFEIVGEAANGQTGLDLITRLKPDLVITDIKMPVLDGLEMMKQALQTDAKLKFIILSSYDEFQLVKQAMKLGAEEYLIKLDLEPQSLADTLAAVGEKIRNESGKADSEERFERGLRENIAMLREGFFQRMINRPGGAGPEIVEQVNFLGIELNEALLTCALVRMHHIADLDKYGTAEFRLLEGSFLNTVHEIVNDIFKGYTFNWNRGEFLIVFSGDPGTDRETHRDKARQMAERLIQVLKQYFNIPVAIGISNLFQGYPQLAQAYYECCRAVQQSLYTGSQAVFFTEGDLKVADNLERSAAAAAAAAVREKLPRALEAHDLEAIRAVFQGLVALLDAQQATRSQALDLCFQIVFVIGGSALGDEALREILGYQNSWYESILTLNTLPEITNWLTSLEQGLCRCLSRNEEQKNHRLIARAKKYIQEHYEEEISLNEVAAALNISHGYFSTIFKQYTGTYFTDYVNQLKIDQAKKLLRETDYKIYEISNMLGYQNAYYFSKVFKKITGMTPSEFSGKNL